MSGQHIKCYCRFFGLCLLLIIVGAAQVRLSASQTGPRLLAQDDTGGSDGAISPDGKHFVVSSKRSGNWELWQYALATKEWKQLTNNPADDFEAQWSPDGSHLVFTSTRTGNKDVWTLSLKDGALRQLTNDEEDDEYPAWSPDGQSIVFSGGPWGQREMYLMTAKGGGRRQITNRAGRAGACAFAPAGQYLSCHSYETGTGAVYKLPLNGGAPQILTGQKEAWDYKPTVSANGKWIAFSRSLDGPTGIWLMPASGGSPVALTNSPFNDRWPSWTKDNSLFFHRIVDEGVAVKIFDRNTGKIVTLASGAEKPGPAAFSPDGRKIAYSARVNGKAVLRVQDIANSQTQTLNTAGQEADFPRWSPDGSRLAFVTRKGSRWEVATINSDGTGFKMWTEKSATLKGMAGVLDWSPDGARIVFQGDTEPFEADLYILDTANGKIANITNDKWFDESPAFTPDGKGVIFMSTRGGNWTWGLFRLSLEDGTVGLVATPDYTEKNFPRPDKQGRFLWSAYSENGIEQIVEKKAGGELAVLMPNEKWSRWPSTSNDGRFVLFTQVRHTVEYWLLEDVANQTALASCDINQQRKPARATAHAIAANAGGPLTVRRSPVNFPHR